KTDSRNRASLQSRKRRAGASARSAAPPEPRLSRGSRLHPPARKASSVPPAPAPGSAMVFLSPPRALAVGVGGGAPARAVAGPAPVLRPEHLGGDPDRGR